MAGRTDGIIPRRIEDERGAGSDDGDLEGDEEQRDAHRGHDEGDPRRVQERADHEPLGEQPEPHGEAEGEDHRQQIVHVAAYVQRVQHQRRHRAELRLGEVEHPRALVDEHDPDGEQPVDGSIEEPDRRELQQVRRSTAGILVSRFELAKTPSSGIRS